MKKVPPCKVGDAVEVRTLLGAVVAGVVKTIDREGLHLEAPEGEVARFYGIRSLLTVNGRPAVHRHVSGREMLREWFKEG